MTASWDESEYVFPSFQNLLCGALTGGNCTVNGSLIAVGVGCFAGKEDRVGNWFRELGRGVKLTDGSITVGASSEGIAGPIVKAAGDKRLLQARALHIQEMR